MIRLSASLLDAYQLYRDYDFMTAEELDKRLRREPVEPTGAMKIGIAFHAISEGTVAVSDPYQVDGFSFDKKSVDDALKHLCGGTPEVKDYGTIIPSPLGDILITARADYLRGDIADEIKTKIGKDLDPENYASLWQWKVYCRVFKVSKVVYHLVRLDEDKKGVFHAKSDILTLYPYPGIEEDVDNAFRGLAEYAEGRGLLDALNYE